MGLQRNGCLVFSVIGPLFGCASAHQSQGDYNVRKLIYSAGLVITGLMTLQPALAATTLRLGHQNAPTSSLHLSAMKFAELVDERTGGEVTVEVFPSGQLGGLNDLWTGVKIGTVDIAATLPATVAVDLVPSVAIFDSPYMFTSVAHFERVWTGDIGEEITDELAQKAGVRLLSMETFGSRQLTAKRAILKPEDLAGMKIRSVTLPTFIATIEALGATPTPMDYAEVYQGLLSGVIDGQENPPSSIFTARFQEVQSHLMMTSHMLGINTTMMNEGVFQRLSPEHQQIVVEAAREAGLYGNQVAGQQQEELLVKLAEGGMTIIDTEQGLDLEAFRTRVREQALPKISANWPEGLIGRVQALADR
jgi:tripartite ATP-independent transporter DctP family solute receptor